MPLAQIVSVSGEVILILDDGAEHHLKNPGDTVVQRGTLHAWKYDLLALKMTCGLTAPGRNPGAEWCRWTTVLIAAEPTIIDSKPVEPIMGEM
jgi:hypothetical protein